MVTGIALIFSIVLQFIAAFVAMRLIKVTGWRLSWILISLGLLFMAVRRFIEVMPFFFGKINKDIVLTNEWIGITISILITIGVFMVGEVFHSLKKAEKDRKESEEKFRTLFDSSSDEIYLIDRDQKFIEMNRVVYEALGYTRDELLGKDLKIIKSEKCSGLSDTIVEKIRTQKTHVFESEHKTKNGTIIPVEIKSRLIDYGSESAILSMARDITERKQTERKILNAVIETEERDKERFARDLHDGLGSLLSSINIYINLIRSEDTDESEKKEILDFTKGLIDEAIASTKEIANNLRPNIISRFGLVASIRSFYEKLNETGLVKINLENNIEDKELSKDIEVTLYRVLKELITNTLKHASADKIDMDLSIKNNMLILNYYDNGIGFDINKMLKKEKATGMGISNIISRIKAINGSSEFTSSEGKGLHVTIKVRL